MAIRNSSSLNVESKNQYSLFRNLLLVCIAIVVFVNYLLLFKNAFHGLDISDEGMYLLSVSHVSENTSFHNPFGDYTRLLYLLSFQKVWLFRITGFVALGAAGAYLSSAVCSFLPRKVSKSARGSVLLSGLLIGPFYYSLGILTPSYNWLNLLCLSIGLGAVLHLLCSLPENTRCRIFHIATLAISIWVGSFAKISTGFGIFLLFIVLTGLLREPLRQTSKILLTLFSFIIVFALLHHLLISDLEVVLEKISRGQEALEILDPRYSIALAMESFKSGSIRWIIQLFGGSHILLLLIAGFLGFIYRFNDAKLFQRKEMLAVVLALPLVPFLMSVNDGNWSGVAARYNDQMWAVTQFLSLSLLFALGNACLKRTFPWTTLISAGLLLGGPVLYAFGSNNGFVEQITGATGIIGVASLVLLTSLGPIRNSVLPVVCLLLSIGAITTTINSAQDPYRQAPLTEQTVLIEIAPGAGRLYVEKNFAEDINSLRGQLKKSGWKSRTPILDFTQYSAGIVYAIDALQPVTVIPTVGGMDGVNALAEWSFNYISEHDESDVWNSAWLLFPSEKNLKNCQLCPNASVLSKLNRTFPQDYVLVATSKNFRIYKPRD